MRKILVTGGTGYIGSHTLIDLIDNGFDVVSVDNFSRSSASILDRIKSITGNHIEHFEVDLCQWEDTKQIFARHPDIKGIIHFAAFKTVPESVEQPLLYYENNLVSHINLLKAMHAFGVPHFVFSSSCSVYGNADRLPVTEDSPVKEAESPYGRTKHIGEEMIKDDSQADQSKSYALLRYFNPVGAHPSGKLGEMPIGTPNNLVPIVTQTAIGKREQVTVFGQDYATRDGTCIRDYVHVMDIANAHTKALQYLEAGRNETPCEIFNLGTGNGITVLEAIKAFENATGVSLNYTIGERRPGDVEAIYADNTKAKKRLGWQPVFNLDKMMSTAWEWQKELANEKT